VTSAGIGYVAMLEEGEHVEIGRMFPSVVIGMATVIRAALPRNAAAVQGLHRQHLLDRRFPGVPRDRLVERDQVSSRVPFGGVVA
jgi:hypothetical protein